MTKQETLLWNLVTAYTQEKFGYSVTSIREDVHTGYTIELRKFGSPVPARQVTVFSDAAQRIITDKTLEPGFVRSIDQALT